MNPMLEKIQILVPEIVLVGTAFVVMILGLSRNRAIRRSTFLLSAASLIVAALIVIYPEQLGLKLPGAAIPGVAVYLKLAILAVGFLLLLAAAEVPDESHADVEKPGLFDPAIVARGEFFGFFLLSLAGAMLTVTADDLIWLFLALELTSLPTYVMVATARDRIQAPEAGVKYFFLGAFAAAIFLYGFTLLYGATGTTSFTQLGSHELVGINLVIHQQGLGTLGMIGLLLAITGLCFKIAAVPMHAYAADVYQGAATPVTAFLAFVPKTAGFAALIAVVGFIGWPLNASRHGQLIYVLLWILAVATMYVGNTLALRQSNVKRVLAYSSIAHSGYMLVGLVAGPVIATTAGSLSNGIAAVLFYLVCYGIMNLGAFAVLGILRSRGEEAETFGDLRGLAQRHPALATVMAVCCLSLAGIPPILGFWGKLYLVGAAISAGEIWLVILMVMASAIGAVYYLRIIAACFLPEPTGDLTAAVRPWRATAALASAVLIVVLSFSAGWLVKYAHQAADIQAKAASHLAQAK